MDLHSLIRTLTIHLGVNCWKPTKTTLQTLALCSTSALAALASPAVAQTAQPTSVTDTIGTTTTLTPRNDGFGITVQAARGVTTDVESPALGQLTQEIAPERGTLRYQYDEQGRPSRVTQADGMKTLYSYDEQGRPNRIAWRQDGQDRIVTRYGFDDCDNGENRLCSVRHDGHVSRYSYTPEGRLAAKRQRLADEDGVDITRYTYDADGRVATLRYPSGLKLAYKYDDQGRIKRLMGVYETGDDRERFAIVKSVTYDEAGRVRAFTHGNGVRTSYRRDDFGRITRTTLRRDGVVLDRTDYSFDDQGRVSTIARLDDTQNRAYRYDGLGRLVSETHGNGTANDALTIDYGYDSVGNRVSRTENTRQSRYAYAPDSNRLTQRGRDSVTYDARGNTVSDRQGRRRFKYDTTIISQNSIVKIR